MDPITSIALLLAATLIASWFFASQTWARILLAMGRRSAGLRSRFIEDGNVRWHFLAGRHAGPMLLALHGFGGDCDNWLRAAPQLGRHFRVIAPDLPGFGESHSSDHLQFDIASQLERLHAFIELLDTRAFFLAGNSMGGWIASAYALKYPAQVRALWLLAPLGVAGSPSSPLLDAIREGQDSPLSISNGAQFRRRVVQPMFGRAPWIPYPLQDYYAHRGVESSASAGERFEQLIKSPVPLEQIAAELELPVHLQWGSLDRAVSPQGVEVLQRSKPDIDVHVLEGVGHLPMLEAPSESADHWISFCRCRDLLDSQ